MIISKILQKVHRQEKEKNKMTILTQDETFVNYDHVIKIACFSDQVDLGTGIPSIVSVVKAYLDTGRKIKLAIYTEPLQFEEVMKEFETWLNEKNEYHQVFEFPEMEVFPDINDLDDDDLDDGEDGEDDED